MTGNRDRDPRGDTLRTRLIAGIAAMLALSLAGGAMLDSHAYFPVAGLFGFPVWFGLGIGLALVLLVRLWSALFRREEGFYDD